MKQVLFAMALLLLVGASCTPSTQTTNLPVTNSTANNNRIVPEQTTNTSTTVSWFQTGSGWQASSTPPSCPTPFLTISPVDISKVTSVLYPGQIRGGNYKPHGGFRFQNSTNAAITVKAPMDATVFSASRYIEAGETQYLFTFVNPCGIMYRFDHLLTLSPAMQAIAETLPPAEPDNSMTTQVSPPVSVRAGDVIATAVGFAKTRNVSVDFGLYDLRSKNAASENPAYAAAHDVEQAQHALCWLPLLPGADAAKVATLPGADQAAGTTSDYCSAQ